MMQTIFALAPDCPTAWVHNVNPFLLEIMPGIGIRWYGLAYLAGFYLGFLFIRFLALRGRLQLRPELAGDFVMAVAIGAVLGGRLGYCILYAPQLLVSFRSSVPFWGVLAVNEGGMASHGGIIGVVLGAWLFARKHKLALLPLMDLTTIGGTLGIFFGRIANFINGELYGRPAPECFRWAIKFPQELGEMANAHSPQLAPLHDYILQLGVHGIIERIQHHDTTLINAVAPLLTARYPSQLLQAFLEGLLLFVILAWVWRQPRKPGVVAGIFLTLYPLVRIIGEHYRMPDMQIGFELFGLTRGQWLSIFMFIVTSSCTLLWMRRPGETHGGWLR